MQMIPGVPIQTETWSFGNILLHALLVLFSSVAAFALGSIFGASLVRPTRGDLAGEAPPTGGCLMGTMLVLVLPCIAIFRQLVTNGHEETATVAAVGPALILLVTVILGSVMGKKR